ncbi:MAG: copper homeostasis protein CutC [Tannerellaceae bacterium]|jgi:copper homeostasis protein|nr:copper homeostasis protein CutC [Tannerellaceae bacterium]
MINKARIIEICADSAYSCVEAEAGGARRVELCAGIPEGGTTPSYGEIRTARSLVSIGIHVIIRPRGGDFLYSSNEIRSMQYDIEMAKDLGADGYAMGCLMPDGNIDTGLLQQLVRAASPLPVTFHRAFDVCRDPFLGLEQIIDCGCARLLTSGQAPDAVQGIALIADLIRRAAGRIVIMPGCGVREHNIARIEAETGATEFHTSARRTMPSRMEFRNERVPMSIPGLPEFDRPTTNRELVARYLQ